MIDCEPAAIAGSTVGHGGGELAQRSDLVEERVALGGRRQVALEEQVPHVLEPPLVGQLDGVVLAVVVEALEAPDVADLGLGHDHALEPGRRLDGRGVHHRLDRGDAQQVAHRHDADEAVVVDDGDVAVAVRGEGVVGLLHAECPGPTTSGSAVIHSATFDAPGSTPAAPQRTRSRSVRMPIGRSPSTTTTEPTLRSRMRVAASATVSSGRAVTTGELISSPTDGTFG